MTNDIRRQWHVALAALLIWSSTNLIGSPGQAADGDPAAASDAEAQAITERLDAMIERAAARVGQHQAGEGEPDAEVLALRKRLEAAETQMRLLKNVVIQALRAQSAAEEALRREQAAGQSAAAPEPEPAPIGSQDQMLADQLDALTDSVRRLRADVDALRGRPSEKTPEPDAGSVVRPSSSVGEPEATVAADPLEPEATVAADPLEEDAMLPEAGMGGRYEPLIEDELPQSPGSAYAAIPSDASTTAAGDPIKVAEVHFNPGSAQITRGGELRTLEAVERIRSMGPAKVRVVGFADRVGDSAYNLVLSKERALSIAAVLESVGLGRDMVEVVGSGEEGIPVPTADGVPEPLNRCAGIYVVPDSAGS